MLHPLYDKDMELVGWVDSSGHIFDTALNWVAFVSDGHAWSANNIHLLGPVKGRLCADVLGKPVAWNPEEGVFNIRPQKRPPRALPVDPPQIISQKPVLPAPPAEPVAPSRGWSSLTFEQWLSQ